MRPKTVAVVVAATLIQILCHFIPLLGRYVDIAGMGGNYSPQRRYFGVLSNAFDNFSYAAWAEQARQGAVAFTDIYTTEPHAAAMFNPYFLVMGWCSALSGIDPLVVMSVIGLLAIPVFGWLVGRICADLALPPPARFLAVLLAMFATGPSMLLVPVQLLLDKTGSGLSVAPGIDSYYYDLFPATDFMSFPYHSVCVLLTAAVLLLMLRVLRGQPDTPRIGRVLGCAACVALLILARPFQAAVLGLLFPLMLAARGLIARRPRATWITEAALALAVVALPSAYVGLMSRLAVWNYLSKGYQFIEVDRWQIIFGFSLFWIGSALGARRAWRERRVEMLVFVVWFAGTLGAALVLGKLMTKFADGAIIDYAILSAYGLEPILFPANRAPGAGRSPAASLALIGIVIAIGTTMLDEVDIFHSITPEADTDLLAIAARLRALGPAGIPLVLTDCDSGLVLPAFARARVYSGHWGLTLDYAAKCHALAKAGLDPTEASGANEADFRALLAQTRPGFLVMRVGAPAEHWLGQAGNPRAVWSGQRWRLFEMTGGDRS
jgi:hypothetical protein